MPIFDLAAISLSVPAWACGRRRAAVRHHRRPHVDAVRRARRPGALLRVTAVVAAFGAAGFFFQQNAARESAAERRALDQRAQPSSRRAWIAPGSALGRLDLAMAGDSVETACEKTVFTRIPHRPRPRSPTCRRGSRSWRTRPASRAAADRGYDSAIAATRLALETDRFGILAHVLSVRDSCTPLLCDSYALLKALRIACRPICARTSSTTTSTAAASEWSKAQTPVNGTPVAEGEAAVAAAGTYTTASGPPPRARRNPPRCRWRRNTISPRPPRSRP